MPYSATGCPCYRAARRSRHGSLLRYRIQCVDLNPYQSPVHKYLASALQPRRILAISALLSCVAILVAKFVLAWRININWDEFFFLCHVHELARGDLTLLYQGAYTQLFRWLPFIEGDEIDQIIVARLIMLTLLAVTALLLWKLAAVWVRWEIAGIAPLCYLSVSPVLRHAGSFRADSLLAPLSLAVLVLLAKPRPGNHALLAAGMAFGAALAVTLKAVFLLPVVAALCMLNCTPVNKDRLVGLLRTFLLFGCWSALFAIVLLGLHGLSVSPAQETADFASATISKTLVDVPFFRRATEYYQTLYTDRLAWMLLYAGTFAALLQSRYRPAAACSLALLPILFYRNAFPYYYVVMLAPACVLVAILSDTAMRELASRSYRLAAFGLPLVTVIALAMHATFNLYELRSDEQVQQRALVAAVHRVFPLPVSYIDHSGMIASFPKVNLFMSTWGIENYRADGRSFMEHAIAHHRPPLLLANRPVLDPDWPQFKRLLPRDRALIEQFYLPYWGSIRVAGARFAIVGDQTVGVELPFPGRYRVEASQPLLIDGVLRRQGDTVEIANKVVELKSASGANLTGRFIMAGAQPAPPGPIAKPPFYKEL